MNFKSSILSLSLLLIGSGFAASAQSTSKRSHSQAHRELLANQGTNKDKIKLVEHYSFVDFADEDLEPEIDIYTEGWNSKRVNPFSESQVPDTKVINVTGYHMPVKGPLTSPYGWRKKFGRMHKGVDIGLKMNDTVRAAFDGKIRLTNYEAKGYGNYVIIRHPNGLETVYGHLNKHLVKEDQVVKAGDPIGLGGSTGRSTGPHLHFETRFMGYAINPAAIFDFANKTIHTDTYTFSKKTYQEARSFSPSKKVEEKDTYKSGNKTQATYTVKPGDTLAAIARSYGMSATTLRKLNGMTADETIKAGQVLKLK